MEPREVVLPIVRADLIEVKRGLLSRVLAARPPARPDMHCGRAQAFEPVQLDHELMVNHPLPSPVHISMPVGLIFPLMKLLPCADERP